jgi:sugar lactone lactonase YvrE
MTKPRGAMERPARQAGRSVEQIRSTGISKRRSTRAERAVCLVDTPTALPRSPVWDHQSDCLLWVDQRSGELLSVSLASGFVRSWKLPCVVGVLALCTAGRIVVALVDGVYLFELATHDLHFLAALDPSWAGCALAGTVGADGALWISKAPGEAGPLLRVAQNGRAAYAANARTHAIGRGNLGLTTDAVADASVFAPGRESPGELTTSAIDVEGAHWTCDASSGCVTRLAGDGGVLARMALPTSTPTSCCLGGMNMKLLFVCGVAAGPDARPLRRMSASGGIFVFPVDVAGVPVRRFDMTTG